MGPREVPRIWDRHLLNCAVLTDLVAEGASVCDVGSGAGLPGLAMAIRRPDLRITLLEPLLRRTTFLHDVLSALELANVEVVRGRAEELAGDREFQVVTSRAVAPLPRLLEWCLPLVRPGGMVLAMKGQTAAAEVEEVEKVLDRGRAGRPEVLHLGESSLSFPTTVVRVEVAAGRKLPWPTGREAARARRSRDRRGPGRG